MNLDKKIGLTLGIICIILLAIGLWLIYRFLSESFGRKVLVTLWSSFWGGALNESYKGFKGRLSKEPTDNEESN